MSNKKWLLTALFGLPFAAAGLAYGETLVRSDRPQPAAAYVFPLTGEDLPCPNCCPIRGQ